MDNGHSLEARVSGVLVFASSGKWLHPLLDLERHIGASDIDASTIELHDKIVGRAAALLIVRMGIRRLHADLLSRLGQSALAAASVDATWDALVDRIECRTEELLAGVDDPDEAHAIILERARAAAAGTRPAGAAR